MMNLFSLKNKVAVVTGALGLLGKAHCEALAEAGANVIVCDLDGNFAREYASSLPVRAAGYSLDVTDRDSVAEVSDDIIKEFGHLDILVNNAAINDMFEDPKSQLEQSKFENYPLELWQRSMNVNITGMFICSQIFGSHIAKTGNGSIINIASTYGINAPDQSIYIDDKGERKFYKPPAYSASKGAVVTFTKYLASYWGEKNVRVNCISPGGVENNQEKFFIDNYSKKTMLKRMANRNDFKGALIFLASDASAYVTGTNIIIDGGWTAW